MQILPFVLAAAVVGHEPAKPMQFDLVCKGTETTKDYFETKSKTYETRFRVDLVKGKWCQDDCEGTFNFDTVSDTVLILERKSEDLPHTRTSGSHWIDRRTGEEKVTWTTSDPTDPMTIYMHDAAGQCAAAEFTGFPTFSTKF